MTDEALNPFRDLIVSDARARNLTVRDLNEKPLRVLRERFSELSRATPPRPLQAARPALLVSSDEPGYGKSHLISRLFRELHGQASLVYVQPFQNAATPFQSLMLAVVRELHFPDRESTGAWNRDAPSQLDFLAHAVLAHTLADFIEGAVAGLEIVADPGTAASLRADPMGAFQRGQNLWAAWMKDYWPKLEKAFEAAMARRGLELRQGDAWLRVLRTYAFAPFEPVVRRLCTEWMCGQPIDGEEAIRIGLRSSDAISGDISAEEVNGICRERLRDLCELSAYFRPFVFCFDQTEVYCGAPALARSFGMLIASLVNEARGHLVMVTANQRPWTDRLLPHIEDADRQRIEQPPIFLEGVNRAQAAELVRLRMEDVGLTPADVSRFLEGPWFRAIFTSETTQMGARTFLQKCKEQWSGRVEMADLAALFEERRDQILASPKRHVFEPDTLQWLMEVAARGLPGIDVESIQNRYASVTWKTAERRSFFGFLPGSNWKQWLAVARSSQRCREQEGGACKYVFFRAPRQPPIPGAAWQCRAEIEQAKTAALQIICLTVEELADLYAPRDLYADAAQGDIPFTPEEVIAFVQKRLGPYWLRFAGPLREESTGTATPQPEASPGENEEIPQPPALVDKVRAIVERARFLSIDEVITALDGAGVSRDEVLEAAGFCSEIRLHVHPKMVVLQWQPRR